MDSKQRDINYRPITVLPCVNKVYEVLLGQQVSKFIDDRLSDAITAYRAKNSCETTLIRLTETWRAELDSKKIVCILSSDMSKAFDSLSPQLLINKLQAYNFSDKAIQLIRSYLFSGKREQSKYRFCSKLLGCGEERMSTGKHLWTTYVDYFPERYA